MTVTATSISYVRTREYPKRKVEQINMLIDLFKRHKNILLVGIRDVNTNQIKALRKKLWGKAECKVIKNTLTRIAIEKIMNEKPELKKLLEYFTDMHAIIFTNKDIFDIARIVDSIKEKRPLKPGKISTTDVIIKKGFTGLKPGPEMSEMRMAGLPVRIFDGEVFIQQDYILVRAGQVVSPYAARVMELLDIKPLEVGPKVLVGITDGMLIPEDILLKPLEEYTKELNWAINEARELIINAGIFVPEYADVLLEISSREAIKLAEATGIIAPDTLDIAIRRSFAEIVSLVSAIKDELPEVPAEVSGAITVKREKEEQVKEETKAEESTKKEEKSEEESLSGLGLLFG